VRSVVERLKKKWSFAYNAFDANWRIWAQHVLQGVGPIERQHRIDDPPPLARIEHFRSAQASSLHPSVPVTQGLGVTRRMLKSIQIRQRRLLVLAKDLVREIADLQTTINEHIEIVDGFSVDISGVTEAATNLAASVTDAADTDHM
jgi:hypothetical protein